MRRKVDLATASECDWGFLEDELAVQALDRVVKRCMRVYGDVADRADIYQEACMWLSVRPEKWKDLDDANSVNYLVAKIYKDIVMMPMKRERKRQARLTSLASEGIE